jgi:hypothetical protein
MFSPRHLRNYHFKRTVPRKYCMFGIEQLLNLLYASPLDALIRVRYLLSASLEMP